MKHLNRYIKFFSLLKEQQVPGPEEVSRDPSKRTPMPKWFRDGFYGAGGKKKFGLQNSIEEYWDVVNKYMADNKLSFKNEKTAVRDLQRHLWSRIREPQENGQTLLQLLNNIRKEGGKKPLGEQDVKIFADGQYGLQTMRVLTSLIDISDKDLSKDQIKLVKDTALPGSDPMNVGEPKKDKEEKKTEEQTPKEEKQAEDLEPKQPQVDKKKVEEEGVTGLNPQQLKKKAEDIIRDSFISDESEKSDKFKIGANKPGSRIVYKDKGDNKISPEDLAVLDEYFGQDGFIREKSKEKRYGMKYVWRKRLKTQSAGATPNLDSTRKISEE